MEVNSEIYALAALPPEKEPRYPLDRKLDHPKSRSGRGDEQNTRYYKADLIKEDEVGGTRSTHGSNEIFVNNFGSETLRATKEDNAKMELREIRCDGRRGLNRLRMVYNGGLL
jgi:hypothetical protein